MKKRSDNYKEGVMIFVVALFSVLLVIVAFSEFSVNPREIDSLEVGLSPSTADCSELEERYNEQNEMCWEISDRFLCDYLFICQGWRACIEKANQLYDLYFECLWG